MAEKTSILCIRVHINFTVHGDACDEVIIKCFFYLYHVCGGSVRYHDRFRSAPLAMDPLFIATLDPPMRYRASYVILKTIVFSVILFRFQLLMLFSSFT